MREVNEIEQAKLLFRATKAGDFTRVDQLVKYGADINVQDAEGNTPLHVALSYDNFEMAKYFIAGGADITIPNKQGKNALHVAVPYYFDQSFECFHRCNPGIQEIINSKDQHQNTPLHLLAQSLDNSPRSQIAFTILSRFNPNINAQNDWGYTPLHNAIFLSNYILAKCLLEKGADVNIKNKDGNNVLYLAARQRTASIEIIKSIEAKTHNPDFNQMLYSAVNFGNLPLVKYCLEKSPESINFSKNPNETLLDVAINSREVEIAEYLRSKGLSAETKTTQLAGGTPQPYFSFAQTMFTTHTVTTPTTVTNTIAVKSTHTEKPDIDDTKLDSLRI